MDDVAEFYRIFTLHFLLLEINFIFSSSSLIMVQIVETNEKVETKTEEETVVVEEVKEMTKEEAIKLAEENLKEGKILFMKGDYGEAAKKLEVTCMEYSKLYGDMHPNLKFPMYYYGCSLLEIARIENNVLGESLKGAQNLMEQVDKKEMEKGNETQEQEETKKIVDSSFIDDTGAGPLNEEEVADKVIEAMTTIGEKNEEKIEDVTEDMKDDIAMEEETNCIVDEASSEKSSEEEKKEENEEEKEEEEDENKDEMTNLQFAWETLEVVRLICEKLSDEKESFELYCNCLLRLIEVSLEKDDEETALKDCSICLNVQKEQLKKDLENKLIDDESASRKLASTYYQMGSIYEAIKNYDESIQSFENGWKCLDKYLEGLKKDEKKNKEEIEEIELVMKDVQDKVDDGKRSQMEADALKKNEEEKEEKDSFDKSKLEGGEVKVLNIARKRKEVDNSLDDPDVKEDKPSTVCFSDKENDDATAASKKRKMEPTKENMKKEVNDEEVKKDEADTVTSTVEAN
ncbi:hypothetical protein SNEBB_010075 [Seison nebaliae]|nr:hypothetical protein SNEBB_010075 [Seison nebaliae]